MIDRPDRIDTFDRIEAADDTDRPDRVERADRGPAAACVVYYGPGTDPTAFRMSRDLVGPASAARRLREDAQRYPSHPRRRLCTPWRPADELFAEPAAVHGAAVLIVDSSMQEHFKALRDLPPHVIIITADEASESALRGRAHLSVVGMRNPAARLRTLRSACRFSCARVSAALWWRRSVRSNRKLRALNEVGMSLMLERDRGELFRKLVVIGKQFTRSDGGALYIVEVDQHGTPSLRLSFWEIDSMRETPEVIERLPVDNTSAIGHAALTAKPLVIADVHNLPQDVGFTRTAGREERHGLFLRSLLIVPMVDRGNHVVGVLVFGNRKTDPSAMITDKASADQYVIPYTGREVRLARSLASQAAISIENARLYAQIEQIFESFVTAAVTAIDQRDPTTAGHSIRVATLTVDLAKAVPRMDRGTYRGVQLTRAQMRELHYAAMLHDFGKITVREDVLVKAKKLPPPLLERVEARFEQIRLAKELEYYKARDALTRTKNAAGDATARLEAELVRQLEELERMRNVVREANEPSVVATPASADLEEIARRTFQRSDGSSVHYLATDELHFLQLTKGTLDEHERAEIQSHVDETYRFLSGIPWTDDLKNLVTYAFGHHEKLDGSGYPQRLTAKDLPLQTRLMTIADIFDALTESDRPYKRAVTPDAALGILRAEAADGRLDVELVDLLIESQAYRRILDVDWHDLERDIGTTQVGAALGR